MKINHLRGIWGQTFPWFPGLPSSDLLGDMGPGLRLAPEDVSYTYFLPR